MNGQQQAVLPTLEAQMKDRATVIRELIEDPESFRKKWDAKARLENPAMTDAQLQASWDQLVAQFGL